MVDEILVQMETRLCMICQMQKLNILTIFDVKKRSDKIADVDIPKWSNRTVLMFVDLSNILGCFQEHVNTSSSLTNNRI
jgi:hypothetical protein